MRGRCRAPRRSCRRCRGKDRRCPRCSRDQSSRLVPSARWPAALRSIAQTAFGAAPHSPEVVVYTTPSTQISADGLRVGRQERHGGFDRRAVAHIEAVKIAVAADGEQRIDAAETNRARGRVWARRSWRRRPAGLRLNLTQRRCASVRVRPRRCRCERRRVHRRRRWRRARPAPARCAGWASPSARRDSPTSSMADRQSPPCN